MDHKQTCNEYVLGYIKVRRTLKGNNRAPQGAVTKSEISESNKL